MAVAVGGLHYVSYQEPVVPHQQSTEIRQNKSMVKYQAKIDIS